MTEKEPSDRVNVTVSVPIAILKKARRLNINRSGTLVKGLRDEIKKAEQEQGTGISG